MNNGCAARLTMRIVRMHCWLTLAATSFGQTLLWDNWAGEEGTAVRNGNWPCRSSLLDDLWFDLPVIVADYSMLFIWNSGDVGLGSGVELSLWTDVGGQPGMGGEPGEPFFWADLLTYEEVLTGEIFMGRQLLDIRQQVVPFVIEPGVLWLEMHEMGPTTEGGYQLMTNPIGQEGWVNYDDYGFVSGSTLFGQQYGWDFRLFGFLPGDAGEGFFRSITPVLFTGTPVGGVDELRASDDEYYILTAGMGIQISRAFSARAVFETTLPDFPLQQLGLRVESSTTKPGVRQETALFDFDADRWVVVDDRPLSRTEDQIVTIDALADPDRFINDGDGLTRIRLDAYSAAPMSIVFHELKVDELKLIVTYAPL